MSPRRAAHLPGRRAWRRQDLRHAQRRPAAARPGHRRRRGLRRDPRRGPHGRADRRPRGRPPQGHDVPGHRLRGDGHRRRPRPPAGGRPGRRAGPHQRARQSATRSGGRTSRSSWPPASTSISTVNIQHLESLNDVVERITGVTQRETVPDAVVRAADQIELVDMTPEALRRRMAHGNIYAAGAGRRRPRATTSGRATSAALRELALLWVADRVDEGLAGLPPAPRHHRAVGDAGAGRRGPHRRTRRRAPDPPGRPHGRPAHGRARRRARPQRRRAGRRPTRSCSTSAGTCSTSWADAIAEVAGADVADALVALRPGRERHPDRPRRQSPHVPLGGADPRARSSTGSSGPPPAADRRPRHLLGAGRGRAPARPPPAARARRTTAPPLAPPRRPPAPPRHLLAPAPAPVSDRRLPLDRGPPEPADSGTGPACTPIGPR